MLQVRVFFAKKGMAKYISHLDLQRSVCRGLIRSGVMSAYTEGFNPHIKINFSSPLSVYQESEYEIFDFASELENLSYGEITSMLSAAFPEGLKILKAAEPVYKMSDLAMADYEVVLRTTLNAEQIGELLSGEIKVMKKSKKGDSLTDVSSMIKEKRFEDIQDGVKMTLRASCGSSEHLNVRYIEEFLGDRITDCNIKRLSLLRSDGNILV